MNRILLQISLFCILLCFCNSGKIRKSAVKQFQSQDPSVTSIAVKVNGKLDDKNMDTLNELKDTILKWRWYCISVNKTHFVQSYTPSENSFGIVLTGNRWIDIYDNRCGDSLLDIESKSKLSINDSNHIGSFYNFAGGDGWGIFYTAHLKENVMLIGFNSFPDADSLEIYKIVKSFNKCNNDSIRVPKC
jgi:hypothetical protein